MEIQERLEALERLMVALDCWMGHEKDADWWALVEARERLRRWYPDIWDTEDEPTLVLAHEDRRAYRDSLFVLRPADV